MSRAHYLVTAALLASIVQPEAAPAAAQEPPAEPVATSSREGESKPPPRRRRRPRLDSSNTGYIDSAIVGSQLRLRFDAASGADRPDRAEFIYGKCLCFTAFGQDGASPGPTRDLDSKEMALTYEHAFSDRFSVFVEVPFRGVDITFPTGFEQQLVYGRSGVSNSGLGDVRPGLKYALVARPDRYLTLQLKGYLATGEAAEGLGTGHDSIEPGLLYFDQRSPRLSLAAELRWWHPLGGSSDPLTGASIANSDVGRIVQLPGFITGGPAAGPDREVRNDEWAGDILRFGVGLSYELGGSQARVIPVAELVGWHVLDGFATPPAGIPTAPFTPPFAGLFIEPADGDTILNLKLGVRLPSTGPGSVYLGYGFPLSDQEWYGGILRVEYRLSR